MTIPLRLGKGQLPTTLAPIDTATAPAGTIRVIKSITITNTGLAPATVSLAAAEILILSDQPLGENGSGENTITIPNLDQIIYPGERISGKASEDGVYFIISGMDLELEE